MKKNNPLQKCEERTMYSGSSSQYWKQKEKPHPLKLPRNILALGFIILSFAGIGLRSNNARKRLEEQRRLMIAESMNRPLATEEHHTLCERNMRDALRLECDQMCSGEIMSIPRPIMYKSCHHGCSRSFYSAAVVGCRQGNEDEVFRKMNMESHKSCSIYVNTDPKPDAQSTCKKYYRAGTKRGRQAGIDFINNILELEWERKIKRATEIQIDI